MQDLPFYQTPEGKDLLPPRLTSEGARVDPAWFLKFLHDPSLSGEKTPAQQQQINALLRRRRKQSHNLVRNRQLHRRQVRPQTGRIEAKPRDCIRNRVWIATACVRI